MRIVFKEDEYIKCMNAERSMKGIKALYIELTGKRKILGAPFVEFPLKALTTPQPASLL